MPEQNFIPLDDNGDFHMKECHLLWRTYGKHHVSAPVVIFYRKFKFCLLYWCAHHWSSSGCYSVPASAFL